MSKKDSFNEDSREIPLSIHHQYFSFNSSGEMLEWASDNTANFTLSDKVYCAMIDCLDSGMDSVIVATMSIENDKQIDIVIRRENFQKILTAYTKRLLEAERYEQLAMIKNQIQNYDLEFP